MGVFACDVINDTDTQYSTFCRRALEDSRRATGSIPLQESQHWVCESDIPSQHRRTVRNVPRNLHVAVLIISVRSGSVCLDVINQTWSPMYDMVNIFEVFLPQLLRYPNPTDPLNGEAAALLMRDSKGYDAKVKGQDTRDPDVDHSY